MDLNFSHFILQSIVVGEAEAPHTVVSESHIHGVCLPFATFLLHGRYMCMYVCSVISMQFKRDFP